MSVEYRLREALAEADAKIARLQSQLDMADLPDDVNPVLWQPMETVPKTGRDFLLLWRWGWSTLIDRAHWSEGKRKVVTDHVSVTLSCIAWRPLPSIPPSLCFSRKENS